MPPFPCCINFKFMNSSPSFFIARLAVFALLSPYSEWFSCLKAQILSSGYGFLHFCLLHFLVPAFVSCTIWSWSFQTSPVSFFWWDSFAAVWNYYFNFNSVAFKTLFSDIIYFPSPLGFFFEAIFIFNSSQSVTPHPFSFLVVEYLLDLLTLDHISTSIPKDSLNTLELSHM